MPAHGNFWHATLDSGGGGGSRIAASDPGKPAGKANRLPCTHCRAALDSPLQLGSAVLTPVRCSRCRCCLQLTSLGILDASAFSQPPAALARLTRLQRLCLGSARYDAVEEGESFRPLPPGPWVTGLRCLGASLDVLQRSTDVLSAATQLTRLAVTGGTFEEHSAAFWGWARTHPSLGQLQVDISRDVDWPSTTVHAMCSLAEERPAMKVSTRMAGEGRTFDSEFELAL